MASTAGYLARQAAQKELVRLLYRRALKDTLNWAVHRHLFYQDVSCPIPPSAPLSISSRSRSPKHASDLRDKFEANRHVDNLDVIDRLIDDAEAQFRNFQHPDPYIVPCVPDRSKFKRNHPPPQGAFVRHVWKLKMGNLGFRGFSAKSYVPESCKSRGIHHDPKAMAFARHAGKLNMGNLGFRGFSAKSYVPESCVIRGSHQDIVFPGSMFQTLSEHHAEFPLVSQLLELTPMDERRPYQLSNHWRRILYTAFLHSHNCKMQNDCISNAYDYSNLGVIKGLNVLAFRKFFRIKGKVNRNHFEFCGFVKELFDKFCGLSSLESQFLECHSFLKACEKPSPSEEDGAVLSQHSFFVEDEQIAGLYSEIHRFTRQELKNSGLGHKGGQILRAMDAHFKNRRVMQIVGGHKLLQCMLGSHYPWLAVQVKTEPYKGGVPRPLPGIAIVDLHSIAAQHGIEDNVLDLVYGLYPESANIWGSYSRLELMQTLRYIFPEYLDKVLFAFKDAGVLNYLSMHRRLPIHARTVMKTRY